MLFWSGKPLLPAQGLEGDTIRARGREFGRPGDNARKRMKEGEGSGSHSFAPQTPMTPISRVNRDIFHDIARWKGARASRRSGTLSRLFASFPPLALLCRYHAAFCESAGGGWKVFRVVIPGVITPRASDESKIPRCKCDRPSSGRPPTGFRLFAQPVFLRIYRPLFGKLLRKFVNFWEIFIKLVLINDCVLC